MTAEIKRTAKDIEATADAAKRLTEEYRKHARPGAVLMTYEKGVATALAWVLGDGYTPLPPSYMPSGED